MINEQLELGFGPRQPRVPAGRRERRITRAQWWFAHMRQIVDRAFDWESAREARPEQVWFPGAQHQVEV